MEQRVVKRGRPRKAATPIIPQENIEVVAEVEECTQCEEVDVPTIDAVELQEDCRPMKLTREQRSDTDLQLTEIKGIVGDILIHMRQAVQKKQLDFNQELKLLTTFAPYLGYDKVGNKTPEDLGMDSFAMKYIEINARVKTMQEKSSAKVVGR